MGKAVFQLGEIRLTFAAGPVQGRRAGIAVTEYTRYRYGPVYDKASWMVPIGTIGVPANKCARVQRELNRGCVLASGVGIESTVFLEATQQGKNIFPAAPDLARSF